jgi:hypothetical protein
VQDGDNHSRKTQKAHTRSHARCAKDSERRAGERIQELRKRNDLLSPEGRDPKAQAMSFGLPNPRRKGDDVQIRSALGLHFVKPISAKGREWFMKNTRSVKQQFLVGDVLVELIDSFEQLGFQVVVNPPAGDDMWIRKIVSERLAYWRKNQQDVQFKM